MQFPRPAAADPRGRGGDRPPPDWGQKKIIARPKNTHLQTPFCMAECAKTLLQRSRIQNFPGEDPWTPSSRGGEGTGEGGEEWGMGGALDMSSPPQRQALDPPLAAGLMFLWLKPRLIFGLTVVLSWACKFL